MRNSVQEKPIMQSATITLAENLERELADGLLRIMRSRHWIDETRVGCLSTHPFPVKCLRDDGERFLAWGHEAVLVALTHPDPLVVFRSLLQAKGYGGKVQFGAQLSDALAAAQHRVERWLNGKGKGI